MTIRRHRRLRVLAFRGLRVARRHYVTMISASVLGAAAALALTSSGFESPPGLNQAGPQTAPAPSVSESQPAAAPASRPARTSARQRRQAIVFIVTTELQGANLLATHNGLVWDTHQTDSTARVPDVHYVVAGTIEAETLAIERLNSFIEVSAVRQVDLRIIDLRPGRGFAANNASP